MRAATNLSKFRKKSNPLVADHFEELHLEDPGARDAPGPIGQLEALTRGFLRADTLGRVRLRSNTCTRYRRRVRGAGQGGNRLAKARGVDLSLEEIYVQSRKVRKDPA